MKKKWYIILGVIQMFVGIGAVASGLGLILEPDGSNLGMNVEALTRSPFSSYLIPGILLLIVNGVGNIMGGILSLRKHVLSGYAGVLLGGALIIWIIVQVIMIGFSHWLQPTYLGIGIAEFFLGLSIWKKPNLGTE